MKLAWKLWKSKTEYTLKSVVENLIAKMLSTPCINIWLVMPIDEICLGSHGQKENSVPTTCDTESLYSGIFFSNKRYVFKSVDPRVCFL